MRVHHLRCGTMCPFARRLFTGEGGLLERGELVCHVLLVEAPGGLVLVDTGFGTDDLRDPATRLGPVRHLLQPTYAPAETARSQIEALGLDPADVRHIILTHLDLDHAGGLSDFPAARVHLLADEHGAALAPPTAAERSRYRSAQWAHGPDWRPYAPKGEPWKGFACVRDLDGLPPEILLVPLTGHTRGHAAVAVETEGGWLLHCGDAYFFRGDVAPRPWCPPGLRLFQRASAWDWERMVENQGRLRELRSAAPDVQLFSAHDPVELAALAARARAA